MKCPIYRLGAMISYQNIAENEIVCDREECAWWDSEAKNCAVKGLHIGLGFVVASLLELLQKMPYQTKL